MAARAIIGIYVPMKKWSSSLKNELIPFMINLKILQKEQDPGFCHACYGNNHTDKGTVRVSVINNAIFGWLERADQDGLGTMNTYIKKKHERRIYAVTFGPISAQSVENYIVSSVADGSERCHRLSRRNHGMCAGDGNPSGSGSRLFLDSLVYFISPVNSQETWKDSYFPQPQSCTSLMN